MQRKMGEGELLDAQGRLVERGCATHEARRYRRAAIKAAPLRIKEWDYYCVLSDAYGVALTVADNDYVGFLGVTWLDFRAGTATSEDVLIPLPMGKMRLPESIEGGRCGADEPEAEHRVSSRARRAQAHIQRHGIRGRARAERRNVSGAAGDGSHDDRDAVS
jgi:hypothetical protein